MIDYLEEHLSDAEALLKRIRQLEQSLFGLSNKSVPDENVDKFDDIDGKMNDVEGKSEVVSGSETEVYNAEMKVNHIKEKVDKPDFGLEIREKEQDMIVNHREKTDDDDWNPRQTKTGPELAGKTSQVEETGAKTYVERAENRVPLSAQLEELDRAVSALTVLIPEGRGTAQGGYSISPSSPQALAADPNITGLPGSWSADRRADGYPFSLPGLQSLAADPNITGVMGGNWNGTGMPASADFAYGGAQSWAEQADRMFRRDSRRYDGGFYLY